MNDFIAKIKTMFLNRNTVTILSVLAGVILLWFVYSRTLSKAVDPVKVPVANKDLTATTIITKEDIDYVEVNSEALKKGSVITQSGKIIDRYVNNNTSIKKGAMFYSDQVVERSKLNTRDFETIPEGFTIYQLKVDNNSTYANSIYPGDKIDLWLKTTVDDNIVYEIFIKSIEVLSVRDSKGLNVFDVAEGRTPAYLRFAVNEEVYTYLSKIEFLSGMQLYPVPKNSTYSSTSGDLEIVNDQLKDLINSLTRQINYNNPTTQVTDTDNNEVTE